MLHPDNELHSVSLQISPEVVEYLREEIKKDER